MSNLIKDNFDIASLSKGISERDRIINAYMSYRILNQNDAIHKIQELRLNDKEVAEVTATQLAISSVPFSVATDDQIIGELIMQRDILRAKLIKLQAEDQR